MKYNKPMKHSRWHLDEVVWLLDKLDVIDTPMYGKILDTYQAHIQDAYDKEEKHWGRTITRHDL